MLFSQLVTLYLTPVFYTYMAGAQEFMHSRKARKKNLMKEQPVAG